MNIPQLRTLVAISDTKGFASAAERLFVTPAAVSQQMRTLEDELQVALFDRTTRPPRLNAHGVHIANRAREVLRAFDAFTEEARAPDELAGVLTLGCISGFSSDLIPIALGNLRQRYPRLMVRIEEGQSTHLINQVRRRELDAAIVTEPLVPEPELEMLLITAEPLVVVAPPDASAKSWSEALTTLPFLRLNPLSGMGILIDTEIRKAGLVVSEAMELDSSEVVISMVRAGLGAGVVPAGRLKGEQGEKIRQFAFGAPAIGRRVVLVERPDYERSDLSQVLYLELKRLTATGDATGHASDVGAGEDTL
ncbi:MAG: LysR family transcriptional regulator [Hyphomicrobiaceae bacterium]|nr:LysR family transcriptional regulator [Hyphomicrobiaceae bacterium]